MVRSQPAFHHFPRPLAAAAPAQLLLALLLIAATIAIGTAGCDSTGPSAVQPTLNSLAPDSGTVGTEVQVLGSGFRSGLRVSFGPFEATPVTVVSSTA